MISATKHFLRDYDTQATITIDDFRLL